MVVSLELLVVLQLVMFHQKLHQVVDYLLEKESMTGEQFQAIMEGREIGEASATAMFDSFAEAPREEGKTEEPDQSQEQ